MKLETTINIVTIWANKRLKHEFPYPGETRWTTLGWSASKIDILNLSLQRKMGCVEHYTPSVLSFYYLELSEIYGSGPCETTTMYTVFRARRIIVF